MQPLLGQVGLVGLLLELEGEGFELGFAQVTFVRQVELEVGVGVLVVVLAQVLERLLLELLEVVDFACEEFQV